MSTQTHAQVPTWTLGDRLRKARETAGLTQIELSGMLGIARNTVGNYELGESEPKAALLARWATACGVPAVWLAFGIDDSSRKPPGLRRTAERVTRSKGFTKALVA